jgi:predicted metal-dependent hydrolase
VLEARWKTGPGQERDLWQGLAQICVGLTHIQRGNHRGAAALLTRGMARLSAYGPRTPYGTDLDELARTVQRLMVQIETGVADPPAAIAAILAHLPRS